MGPGELAQDSPLRLRAFFGLPVPEAQRRTLEPYLARCGDQAAEFRWVAAANLHLTVRFVGQVDSAQVHRIAGRLAAQDLAGFELELGDLGAFQRGRLARVVWIGLARGRAEAAALASSVEAECVQAGLVPEARPFQPHLTLARSRARDGSVLPPLPPAPAVASWRASELVLYESRLGRTGAVYEPLVSLPLR